jgi:hypothetical protein
MTMHVVDGGKRRHAAGGVLIEALIKARRE